MTKYVRILMTKYSQNSFTHVKILPETSVHLLAAERTRQLLQ